jgi:hypothetical protein
MGPQGLIHEAELTQAPVDMQLPTTNGASYEYGISAELMHVSVGDVDHALRYHPAVSTAAQQPDTDHVLPDFEPYRTF